MPAQRIKGQEVQILIVQDSVLQDTLTDIQDFNGELELEIKSQGYLGEKSNRKDEIFNGVKFDMSIHMHSQDFFVFQQAIVSRAKRITPDTVFNISGVFSFPNGDTPIMLFPDAKFGPQPLSISSRGDYVKAKIAGECDDYDLQTT
jgi:hypothetical protein